jgi:hypothetical protein
MSAGIDLSPKVRFESNINYNYQYTDNIPEVTYGPNSLIYNMTIWGGAGWDVDDMRNYWQKGKEGLQQIYADYTRYNNPWFMAGVAKRSQQNRFVRVHEAKVEDYKRS